MATTGDNRVWAYDARNDEITVIYDDDFFQDPILMKVDNLTVSPRGDIFVAEDGDNMQLVALTANGDVKPFLQVVGHDKSEITGPAFDPSGTRLYFSSQRGATGLGRDGVTFEVQGPFLS
jgi:secreted PhoX family phosphatase